MNSKAKGSAFEREICRKLSLWVTNGRKTDCFWRSAMSGGRATVARNKGVKVRQAGDITAVAPEGHVLHDIYIECRFYKNLSLDSFFLENTGTLASHWRAVKREAASHDKQPWLIAKQNHKPVILLTEAYGGRLQQAIVKGNNRQTWREPCVTYADGEACEVWIFEALLKLRLDWKVLRWGPNPRILKQGSPAQG